MPDSALGATGISSSACRLSLRTSMRSLRSIPTRRLFSSLRRCTHVIRRRVPAENARDGFTLMEVVAGLALVGLVLAGIQALLVSTTDGRERIAREADVADEVANGERLLASLFANAEVSTDSLNRFVGDETHATFNTRCMVPAGWQETCRVQLRVADAPAGRDVAWIDGAVPLILRHFDRHAELRYFGVVGAEEQWVNQWGTSIALPEAIALVAAGDTIVVGGRGRQ